jgi:hypothetical protein
MQKKKYIILTAVVVITLLTASGNSIAHAMGGKNHSGFSFNSKNGHKGGRPGMGGAVAAINGTTITITGQNGSIYTVDTAKAKITRGFGPNTETLALTDIKVGDKIGIIGTISGTNITAKTIIDGVGMLRDRKTEGQEKTHVVGKILTVSPFSLTLEVKPFSDRMMKSATETVTYTVDSTSNTTVTKDGVSASLGDLTVGQMIIATGKVDSSAKTVEATKINIMTLKDKPTGLFKRMGRMMKK